MGWFSEKEKEINVFNIDECIKNYKKLFKSECIKYGIDPNSVGYYFYWNSTYCEFKFITDDRRVSITYSNYIEATKGFNDIFKEIDSEKFEQYWTIESRDIKINEILND